MYNPEEIEAQKEDLREAVLHARPFVPLYVKMKVFYGCNLKCEMCNHWRERREPPLAAERFKEIIGELGELGTKKSISRAVNLCCARKYPSLWNLHHAWASRSR